MTREIAVLRVGAVAEIGPETMDAPGVRGQELAFVFEAGVGVPELREEEQTAVGLDTAGVDSTRVCLCGAGEVVRDLTRVSKPIVFKPGCIFRDTYRGRTCG